MDNCKKSSNLLFVGKGGSREGMGHLVRIGTLLDTFDQDARHRFDMSVLVKHDRFGQFYFSRKGIVPATYKDNRGLYRYLEHNGPYDVIIIDIYRIALAVIARIKTYCRLLIHFDDMQLRLRKDPKINGVFVCPQEPFNRIEETKNNLTVIRGTDFFPLRPEFAQCRSRKQFSPKVSTVGVILGGVPDPDYTLELVKLLDNILERQVRLKVVMGYDPGEVDTADYSSRVLFVKNVEDMAGFIAGIDVGIIAGGFIKFEMMCVGTPFGLISLCEHQQKLARKFSRHGYGVYWGSITNILAKPGNFKRKITAFLTDASLRKTIFTGSRRLVDGNGSSRIVELTNAFIENE